MSSVGPLQAALAPSAQPPRWELYRLLSDPVRLSLLALVEEEELAVGELAEILDEGQPKVSRHATQLRDAGIVNARKQGSWVLLSLAQGAASDAVLRDALTVGRSIASANGLIERARAIVSARDEKSREFFARAPKTARVASLPREASVCLSGLAPLLSRRGLAVDAGTGDGVLLEMLSPLFDEVLAFDRSAERLATARERTLSRGLRNIAFEVGELESLEVRRAVEKRHATGADLVIASRILHHAPQPRRAVAALAALLRPGGTLLVIDYAPHDEAAMSAEQADVWMGFAHTELRDFAESAGLERVSVREFAPAPPIDGPDGHLAWTLLSAHKPNETKHSAPSHSGI